MPYSLKNDKTAELQAVQGAVRARTDSTQPKRNAEMRNVFSIL
jgi:hypothetical protein